MSDETTNLKRRDFLKLLATGVGATAMLEVANKNKLFSRPVSSVESDSEYNWAMVIDQEKCIGCGHCNMACKASNDIAPDISWNHIFQTEEIGDKIVYLSVPCQHCEHAPCVSVCPVGASYYREDGIVMMDYDLCIGCRYCQAACPYQARSFNWQDFDGDNPTVPEWGEPDVERRPRGVVEKCTFCCQRIDRGLELGLTPGVDTSATPVCVNACPTGARLFGNLNDPESNVSLALKNNPHYRLREELGTGTRIYYLPATANNEEASQS
jgi:phenylacetyl-CoA:acceptor oxidoreductase subunit 1